MQLVRVPTWLWLDSATYTAKQATVSVPGMSSPRPRPPVKVVWRTGDGAVVTCSGRGTPWTPGAIPAASSPTCGHTYTRVLRRAARPRVHGDGDGDVADDLARRRRLAAASPTWSPPPSVPIVGRPSPDRHHPLTDTRRPTRPLICRSPTRDVCRELMTRVRYRAFSRRPSGPHDATARRPLAAAQLVGARRSPARLVAGLLVVATAVLTFVTLDLSADHKRQVLAVTTSVAAGQPLSAADVVAVAVDAEAGVPLVPAGELASVVGRTAAVPLVRGQLLAPRLLGPPVFPPAGQAVIAVDVKPGQAPAGLQPGSAVLVLAAPATDAAAAPRAGRHAV